MGPAGKYARGDLAQPGQLAPSLRGEKLCVHAGLTKLVAARIDHGAEDGLVDLEMELHPHRARPEAERLQRRLCAGRERLRAGRERERVAVPVEGDEVFGPEEVGRRLHAVETDLLSRRAKDRPAQRGGAKLAAQADAQDRPALLDAAAQERDLVAQGPER